MKCKFHIQEQKKSCKWCTRWRKTFNYFKKRKCSQLTLYCAEMRHYRTGETFYKIGLTSQSTDERFERTRERFDVTIKWEEILPLFQATIKETDLLYKYQVLANRKHNCKVAFSGKSECISKGQGI